MESESQSTQDIYEFKIPLALPYPIQENYVRNFGEFEYNGEHYIFAGQRLSDDTLYIKTVRNIKKKELYKAFEEYAKMSNDMPSSKQKQGRGLLAKIIKEYKSGHACEIVRQTDLLRQIDLFVAFDGKLCEEYVATAFHPPRNFS